METNIKQELRKTYLIAEDRNMTGVDFRFKMLLSNNIKNLLRCTEHNIDDRIRIYYDISGKTSLKDYCKEQGIDGTVLKRIIASLMVAEGECTDYLMDMNNISLDPEHIFMEDDTVYFCYLPWKEGDIREALHELITLLLDIGNSTDMESMSLLYELHGITRKQYSLDDVMERITRSDPIPTNVSNRGPVGDDDSYERHTCQAEDIGDRTETTGNPDETRGTYYETTDMTEDLGEEEPEYCYNGENPAETNNYYDSRNIGERNNCYDGRNIGDRINYYEDKKPEYGRESLMRGKSSAGHQSAKENEYLEKKKRKEERREYRRQKLYERFLREEDEGTLPD